MNKSSAGRFAVALTLAGALWVANVYGQFGDQAAKLNLVKVKDDLFVIHNDYGAGQYHRVDHQRGVILVDDKFEIDHAGILAELKKITDKPVKYVINTHHHADHSGGNAKLQQLNVQVVASVQARENMVDGSLSGLPNVVFDQHARVYLGGKSVELYHFGRAHTNGDIVALFRRAGWPRATCSPTAMQRLS
jgi:glyoxylase-like metal-dependent hydrolase (beta-lactamase superfamily II)